jgi:rubrerythrin
MVIMMEAMLGQIKSIEQRLTREGNELKNSADVYVHIKPLSRQTEPLDEIARSLNTFYQQEYKGARVKKEKEIPDKYSCNDDKLAWMCRVCNKYGVDRGSIRITPRARGEEYGRFYQRFWVDFFLDSRKRSEKHCSEYIAFVKGIR